MTANFGSPMEIVFATLTRMATALGKPTLRTTVRHLAAVRSAMDPLAGQGQVEAEEVAQELSMDASLSAHSEIITGIQRTAQSLSSVRLMDLKKCPAAQALDGTKISSLATTHLLLNV